LKIVGKILIFIQILIFIVSIAGFSIKAHSCLAMHETNYSISNFNKQDCCSEACSIPSKETSIQEVCCSNHEQNIQITSSFTGEKILKLYNLYSHAIIYVQNPINKDNFDLHYFDVIVFTDPPPIFISYNNIRC
jgi:hypothetical protein